MCDGWLSVRTWQKRREALLLCNLSGARLFALGASAALHLLAIAALASFLDYRSGTYRDHISMLTVVSLEPARPAVEPIQGAKPKRHRRRLEAAPTKLPTAPIRAGGTRPASSTPTAAPSPLETGNPAEVAGSRVDAGPRHPTAEPDTALRDYQAVLWRQIDANRPRGVNMSGTVLVLFRLSADGALISASVSRTSGNILLDKIALRSVRQAAPFPRPPGGIPATDLTFEIPINFH